MLSIATYLLVGLACADVSYTVSGFDSGGYMAGQLHIAYSSSITGVGIIGAGPYYCSQGDATTYANRCINSNQTIDVSQAVEYIHNMSATSQIDPISSLKKSKVFLFSGSKDKYVTPEIVNSVYTLYRNFVSWWRITFVKHIPANHAWPTKSNGDQCDYYGLPFINNCNYDASGIMLKKLLGKLNNKGTANPKNFYLTVQMQYAYVYQYSLNYFGIVYVPTSCRSNVTACRVHVNFHGCQQDLRTLDFNYTKNIELADWAETNNLIVYFPQADSSSSNPNGCWDTVGFTGSDFALKSGAQLSLVHRMVQNYVSDVTEILSLPGNN